MVRVTLTVHETVATAIRTAAAQPLETAGVLIVGVSETPDEVRLLAREFIPAPDSAYVERSSRHLRLTSEAYMPALARAAILGGSALFVHSHPDTDPIPSPDDDAVDAALTPVFTLRTGRPLSGSLVVRLVDGALDFAGRLWRDDAYVGPIELLREVGERFTFTSSRESATLPAATIFDRQVRAFGAPMQALLSSLHVGVVGCGGTGSAVTEQLIRLGVDRLTLVDDETLSATNVTRVYGSSVDDEGTSKVVLMDRLAGRIGLGTEVEIIEGEVSRRSTMDSLRACDIVFCCTDDHTGRLDVARLAYWCLIPVLDVGVLLDAHAAQLRGIYARLNVQLPGAACVQCWGTIDQARMRAEQLPPEEAAALEREGYAPALDEPDPAVIPFTTLVASIAVGELLLRLTGAAIDGAHRTMVLVHDRRISTASMDPDRGHWCGQPQTWGLGVSDKRYLGRVGWRR
jgi:proteasome lid subunit RPN8/RPN11